MNKKDKFTIAIFSCIIIGSMIFTITSFYEPEPIIKKTWYAVPLPNSLCMMNDEGSTSVIKIKADNCGACTGLSKNPSGQQLVQKEDRWQIGKNEIEIDFSLCAEKLLHEEELP